MLEIRYSPKFFRQYKKLPQHLKELAEEKEVIFRANPFDPSLKTHKLKGQFEGKWAFSISYSHRIIFSFVGQNLVYWHVIGGHEIYN